MKKRSSILSKISSQPAKWLKPSFSSTLSNSPIKSTSDFVKPGTCLTSWLRKWRQKKEMKPWRNSERSRFTCWSPPTSFREVLMCHPHSLSSTMMFQCSRSEEPIRQSVTQMCIFIGSEERADSVFQESPSLFTTEMLTNSSLKKLSTISRWRVRSENSKGQNTSASC